MMDDLEQRLRAARLTEPSPGLDRRIEAAFREVRRDPRPTDHPHPRWWLGALAAGLSLAAGLLVSIRPTPPPPRPVVYQIEAEGRLRDLLLNPAGNTEALPRFQLPGTLP